jgi:GxxExxY protein
MTENELSSIIIGAAIEVHNALGPGLLESVYEECLIQELKMIGLEVKEQVVLPITYKGTQIQSKLKVDLIVQDKVIVELKAVQELSPIHAAQLLTYLKISNQRLGLLINFNELKIKNGLRRIINSQIAN